jgi:hypothetical protein
LKLLVTVMNEVACRGFVNHFRIVGGAVGYPFVSIVCKIISLRIVHVDLTLC